MKVFVTGGTGFLGTHLVNALLARGDDVTCLVRSDEKAQALERRGIHTVRGDLDDPAALRAGCAGAEVVYHLAGRIAGRNAADFMAANRDGTARLLDAAATARPGRFVFVSSIAAAGPTEPGHPVDETRPPHPVTPYGHSKLAAEALVRGLATPWTIVRPPVVYGEWDRATLDIFRLARRGVMPLFGDGLQEISIVHAQDVTSALVTVATSDRTAARVYFAAHPQSTTGRGLALAVGEAVGRTPLLIPVPRPVVRGILWTAGTLAGLAGRASLLSAERAEEFLAPAWTCRSDALTADTGWEAKIDLATGVRRAAAWYRQEGWLR